jgi:amino acid permease
MSSNASFSPFVCACFAANYIIGTGFLALPWAFDQAGWLVSLVCLAVVCWAENLASDYILSAMARAEWIMDQHQGGSEASSLMQADKGYRSTVQDAPASPTLPPLLVLGNRRNLDLPQVCQLFLNSSGYAGYMMCVHLYLFGSLWMYTSVFGNAVASFLTNSMDYNFKYDCAVALLGGVALPLSWLQLTEQTLLQVFLTASRLLMMLLMVVTPLAASLSDVPHFGSTTHVSDEPQHSSTTPMLDWSGMHRMLPIVVCAAIFHFSIPALAADLANNNKDELGKVFAWTFALVFAVYASIGAVDAWYFGGTIQQSSNVNWSLYNGGTGRLVLVNDTNSAGEIVTLSVWVDVAWWAKAISFFVTMFPAINVISVL